MKKQTWMRQIKRKAMKEGGVLWTDRLKRSLGTGMPVVQVVFKREGKEVIAEAKL